MGPPSFPSKLCYTLKINNFFYKINETTQLQALLYRTWELLSTFDKRAAEQVGAMVPPFILFGKCLFRI